MIVSTNISPNFISYWKEFLLTHPHNNIFQSPEMYFFYQKVTGFKPILFVNKEENGKIAGLLLAVLISEGKGLKGYFSSRVVVYGGPLIQKHTNSSLILNQLLNELIEKTKNKSVFIQFRNFFEWDTEEKEIFQKNGFIFRDRLNLIIDTSDRQNVWKSINESKRRQIRKGLKEGSQIIIPKNEEEVKQFYSILKQLYKNKIKKPLPDWSFFKTFYDFSRKGKLGIIRLIKVENTIVGGIIAPLTQNKTIYEWYVAGLDKEYKHYYPSVMATWAPIDFALKNDINFFDFMGVGVPQKKYGVRDFKTKFGGKMVNYGRFARRNNKFLYALAEFGYNFLRLARRL